MAKRSQKIALAAEAEEPVKESVAEVVEETPDASAGDAATEVPEQKSEDPAPETEPEEVTYFAQPAPVQPIEDPLTSFVQPPKKKEPFLVTIPEDEFGDVAPATTEGQLSIDLSSIKFGDDYSIDDDDDDSYNDGKSLFSRRNK